MICDFCLKICDKVRIPTECHFTAWAALPAVAVSRCILADPTPTPALLLQPAFLPAVSSATVGSYRTPLLLYPKAPTGVTWQAPGLPGLAVVSSTKCCLPARSSDLCLHIPGDKPSDVLPITEFPLQALVQTQNSACRDTPKPIYRD